MNANPKLARLHASLSRALSLFAAVTLFAIMWLTVIDVVSRDVLNVSITGLFEITEILMGVLVFAGVPIVTANQGHVAVTLLDPWVGPRLRVIQKFAINILCMAVLVIFAWRLWAVAERLAEYNDVTLFAHIPLAPVGYFMAVMTMLSVPVQFILTFLPDVDESASASENV